MTDIVDRLTYRAENLWADVRPHAAILDLEAAAEIERLRAYEDIAQRRLETIVKCDRKIEYMRAALEKIVSSHDCDYYNGNPADLADIARNALRERVLELESERAEDHGTT